MKRLVMSNSGQLAAAPTDAYVLTQADIEGANSGQRPDLIGDKETIYEREDGALFQSFAGRLVPIGSTGSGPAMLQRTTPLRVATFGDSTANLGDTSVPNTHTASPVSGAFPASGAAVVGFGVLDKLMAAQFYPQAHVVFNGGVSGEGTNLMLGRDALVSSTTRKAITDLLNHAPDVVLYRGASINELVNVNSGNWQSLADATYAQHIAILHRLLSGVGYVVDSGVFGYGAGSGATGPNPDLVRRACLYLNQKLRANLHSLFGGRVVFVDPVGSLCDSTGLYIPSMTYDGVHLNPTGGIVHGALEAQALVSIFGPCVGPRYPGVNLVPNSLLHATTVTGAGTLGVGYNATTSLGTMAATVEQRAGALWQIGLATCTGAGAVTLYMPGGIPHAALLATDVLGIEYDYFIEYVGAVRPPVTWYGRYDITKAGAGRLINQLSTSQNPAVLPGAVRGRMVFAPMVLGEAGPALASVNFGLNVAVSSACTLRVGVSAPRVVKLN